VECARKRDFLHGLHRIVGVEDEQRHRVRVLGEESEVDAMIIDGGTQRMGLPRFHGKFHGLCSDAFGCSSPINRRRKEECSLGSGRRSSSTLSIAERAEHPFIALRKQEGTTSLPLPGALTGSKPTSLADFLRTAI
jgi:hypothetical protein